MLLVNSHFSDDFKIDSDLLVVWVTSYDQNMDVCIVLNEAAEVAESRKTAVSDLAVHH